MRSVFCGLISIVSAEKIKLLANSFYDYQIVNENQQTVTNYQNDERDMQLFFSKLFKKLDHVNNALFENELA